MHCDISGWTDDSLFELSKVISKPLLSSEKNLAVNLDKQTAKLGLKVNQSVNMNNLQQVLAANKVKAKEKNIRFSLQETLKEKYVAVSISNPSIFT